MKINYTVTYMDIKGDVQKIHPNTSEDLKRVIKKILDGGLELLDVVSDTSKEKKAKVNFTLDPDLVEFLDKVAEDRRSSRSASLNYILRKVLENGL